MNRSQSVKRQTKARKRRIENARKKNEAKQKRVQARIRHKAESSDAKTSTPMFRARNIQYEVSDRIQAIGYGGIGLMHSLAQQSGLIDAIDHHVQLLKVHFPYHESDHVLNIAYNAMTGGQCQILTTGRRTVYRLLAWNDSQPIFWRMVEVLNL